MLSFILPAHNEEANIAGALKAIHAAAGGRPYELIVADDASTDATAALAREHGATVVQIQARHIAAARNAGATAAKGERLFFIDADTQLTPQALTQALAALDRGAVGGGGPMRFDPPVPAWVPFVLPPLQLLFRVLRYTGGAFFFCTRQAFDAAGGWDQTLYASEEIALAKALKKQGRFVIVKAPVITSGRKLRTHSPWEILSMVFKIAFKGPNKAMREKGEHLDLWYGERRRDEQTNKPANEQPNKPAPS
jgi:cellulose synthase/poly-beta-1,6-N-acetylglucosamine synthase-like glycosyltransferase